MCSNRTNRKRTFGQALSLIAFCLLSYLAIEHFSKNLKSAGKVECHFVGPSGAITGNFQLELATNLEERRKGLMYRKPGEMEANQGMLFVFPNESKLSFWMENTYISLDMIFLNKSMDVVGILSDVPILTRTPREVEADSMYVVELLAGAAKRNGIMAKSKLTCASPIPRGA